MTTTKPSSFAKNLAELTELVATIERGELSLEEALAQFARGVTLTRDCHQAIRDAEQQVSILINDTELQPFAAHQSNEDA